MSWVQDEAARQVKANCNPMEQRLGRAEVLAESCLRAGRAEGLREAARQDEERQLWWMTTELTPQLDVTRCAVRSEECRSCGAAHRALADETSDKERSSHERDVHPR